MFLPTPTPFIGGLIKVAVTSHLSDESRKLI